MALRKDIEEGPGSSKKIKQMTVVSVPINYKIDDSFFINHDNKFKDGGVYGPNIKGEEYWLPTVDLKNIKLQMDTTSNENNARKTGDETISVEMNDKSSSSEYKKVWVLLGILMVVLCFHMCTTPLIVQAYRDYIDSSSQFIIDCSLTKTSVLPANLSFGLDEAYILSYGKSYGVVFSHNNLESEFGNFFKDPVEFQRLSSLLRCDYKNYLMIPLITGTGLSTIITVIFGIALYIACITVIYCENKINKKKEHNLQEKTSGVTQFQQTRLILVILNYVLLYHLLGSPLLIFIYTIENTEYAIDVPLKKTSDLPENLSYCLDEAFVFRNGNFYGPLFTHNDSKSTVGHFFTKYVKSTPLLPLIQPNCISYYMVDLPIEVLYFSGIISVVFGIFVLNLYKIIRVYFRKYPQ